MATWAGALLRRGVWRAEAQNLLSYPFVSQIARIFLNRANWLGITQKRKQAPTIAFYCIAERENELVICHSVIIPEKLWCLCLLQRPEG